jgi:hypothetical protein
MQDAQALTQAELTIVNDIMKESIESTRTTIQSIQTDFDIALAKARDDIAAAKLQAEAKLNSLARDLETGKKNKATKFSGLCTAFLSMIMWSFLVVCVLLLSSHASSLNLSFTSAELLFSAYDFPMKVAFFSAAAFYPVIAWHLAGCTRLASKSTDKKIVLVDVGVQTDLGGVARAIFAPSSEGVTEGKNGSVNSEDSVASLTNSDDTIDSYEGEVVHLRAYVEPMRREHNKWKKYGKLLLSVSTMNDKPCMIFRYVICIVVFKCEHVVG